MALLSKIRAGQNSWGRRVLGVFVVAWMSATLQPCLMAMEMADPVDVTVAGEQAHSEQANKHACPHCPPAFAGAVSTDGTHDANNSSSTPCETYASNCASVEYFHHDGRVSKTKFNDSPSDVPLGIVQSVAVFPLAGSLPAFPDITYNSYLPGDQPLLNVLYCVYLI